MTAFAYPQVQVAIRTLVALIFVVAAVGKVRHFVAFQGVLGNYRLLPPILVMPFALLLPPFEAVTAAGLLVGPALWPAVISMALFTLFALAMSINIWRGRRHIDCGCFQSAFRQTLRWTLVTRNAVLVLILGLTLVRAPGPADAWTVGNGLLAGGVLFIVLQSLDILWSLVPTWPVRRRGVVVSR